MKSCRTVNLFFVCCVWQAYWDYCYYMAFIDVNVAVVGIGVVVVYGTDEEEKNMMNVKHNLNA